MQISEGLKANFETLKAAAINNDLSLMDCFDEATQEPVGAVCAVNKLDNGEFEFVPLAIMPYAPLYNRLRPPSQAIDGMYAPLTPVDSEGGEAE